MVVLDPIVRNQLIAVVMRHPSFQGRAEREAFLYQASLDNYIPYFHLDRETGFLFAERLVRDLLTFGIHPFGQFLRTLSQTLRDPDAADRQFLYHLMLTNHVALPAYGQEVDLVQASGGQESAPDPTLLRPTAFFKRGLLAGKSVARLTVASHAGGTVGTGFLVGTSLLLTNHHVVPNPAVAAQTVFCFNYEFDADLHEATPDDYRVQPGGFFLADAALDYALMEVAGRPGERWGFLPLREDLPLAIDDRLNIIQHPEGQHKLFACVKNRLVAIEGDDLVYTTPTERGSSGSPVCNDAWEVVGLHYHGDTTLVDNIAVSQNRGKRIDVILRVLPSQVRQHLNH